MSRPDPAAEHLGRSLAIVGLACRFPGAADARAFWRNLRDGVESISFFTPEELIAAGTSERLARDPSFVRARGVVEDAEWFDAELFGYSPREAELMDPQHRIFLECAWTALEDAACDPRRYAGAIGLFAGVGRTSYLYTNVLANPELLRSLGLQQAIIGNDKDFLTTHVAYRLGLRGPAIGVQTACSTSLVATHLACQALLTHQCDVALAGGVSLLLPQVSGTRHREGGVFSPDGHCRAFDAAAAGTVPGGGAGLVVLKRLEDALAEGDAIRAVVRGSAVNNDGAAKAGYTAPSVDGQAEVVALAQAVAGVEPESVGYVEAHGTGTTLGDPIEVQALREAFGAAAGRRAFCALGSVKTNIGHLDTAAGVAGLIKATLALEHGELPPSLHFERPNPRIDLENGPFYVNDRLRPWQRGAGPRRAGVSSFGIGGTNAHVIVEEAPEPGPPEPSRPWQLLVLSARNAGGLDAVTGDLAAALGEEPAPHLPDVAFTLSTGRTEQPHRRAWVVAAGGDAATALAAPAGRIEGRDAGARPVVFLLPGLGDHYPGMARGLYRDEPAFRRAFDRCADLLAPRLGADLRQVVLQGDEASPAAAGRGALDLRRLVRGGAPAGGELARTALAQPAVFAVEYALAMLWREWGVEPRAMLGYSLGEYVAACLAGVFTLEDALTLVAERARAIEAAPPGAMLAVPLAEAEACRRLGDDLSLAAVNGPALSVVAGSPEGIERLAGELADEGVPSRRLLASHAFHSHLMDGVVDALAEQVASIPRRPPRVRWISNLTGDWIGEEQAVDPRYWAEHMRRPVRFADGLARLAGERSLLLEVGPGSSLSSLAVQALGEATTAVPSMRHAQESEDDGAVLLRALGRLWTAGAEIDWDGYWSGERRRRVSLPGTRFQRKRYWVDEPAAASVPAAAAAETRAADPAAWLYAPGWRSALPQSMAAAADDGEAASWLVLGGGAAAERLAEALRRGGAEAAAGGPIGGTAAELADLLAPLDGRPLRLVHAVGLDRDGATGALDAAADRRPVHGVVALAAALAARPAAAPAEVALLTRGAFRVEGADAGSPAGAALAALGRVLQQEQPGVSWRHLDLPAAAGDDEIELAAAELLAGGEPVLALRGERRWAPLWQPSPAPPVASPALAEGAVVLVTGGLGRLGGSFAQRLAEQGAAGLVLTGRRPLGGDDDPRRERLRRLEALGVEVMAAAVDVADPRAMEELVAAVDRRFGRLDGLVHAAGEVADDALGFLAAADGDAVERHFRPKVDGLAVLDRLLGDRPLTLRWLLSSISTLLGGLRLGPYSAANAVLDAFAEVSRPPAGVPWLSLAWGEVFAEAEVAAVVDRALALPGLRRLAVSPTPLAPRLVRALAPAASTAAGAIGDDAPRPPASPAAGEPPAPREGVEPAPGAAPLTAAEERLAGLWRELLGVERAGRHDNFFQLGGHSLLAVQLIGRLQSALGVNVGLRDVFEAPTVAALAARIEARLVEELTALDEREAERAVAAVEPAPPAASSGRGVVRYQLPNGLWVAAQNRVEADHFYQDIFVDEIYRRGGICLDGIEHVLDVGSNVGMFTLWIAGRCPGVRVYSFEPAPPLFELLEENRRRNGVDGEAFNVGIADREDLARFTYYPHSSGMSSFYADEGEEKAVLRAMLENQRLEGAAGVEDLLRHADELLAGRFHGESYVCQLRPLSALIDEIGLQSVDLLKVDVQKAELEVLRGIRDDHWPLIRQVVLEVHDLGGRLEEVRELLAERGFRVVVEQEAALRGSVLYNLFCVRPEAGSLAGRGSRPAAEAVAG